MADMQQVRPMSYVCGKQPPLFSPSQLPVNMLHGQGQRRGGRPMPSTLGGNLPSLSDLSSVALDAAIQLDRVLQGRPADEAPLKKLSGSLRGASEVPVGGTALSLHYNPAALGVLSRAVERTENRTFPSVTDLARELAQFVEMLSWSPRDWSKETVTRSLTFCLSLHRELVAELSQAEVIVPSDDWTGARL